jgi:hypothetical protein
MNRSKCVTVYVVLSLTEMHARGHSDQENHGIYESANGTVIDSFKMHSFILYDFAQYQSLPTFTVASTSFVRSGSV